MVEVAIKDGISVHQRLLEGSIPTITRMADLVVDTFNRGCRMFFVGNGGSAAEAQHISTEFVVRFKEQRRALPVISLTTDTSVLTATANDYDYSQVFARQVEALVGPGDLFIALSTSGASSNILEAVREAHKQGATTVGFTGDRKGPLVNMVDVAVEVPSGDTQRIQEAHLIMWHIICELVETAIVEQSGVTGT
jgi:D-sedoheptulose 7-phosphate isomerase